MWTLGRDREKEHARKFLGPSKDSRLLEAVIDVVHDLLEGKADAEAARLAFNRGFVEGGGGVWESTGSWLLKVGREFPDFLSLWEVFASHPSAATRFRASVCVVDLPENIAQKLFPVLLSDPAPRSGERWRVTNMIPNGIGFIRCSWSAGASRLIHALLRHWTLPLRQSKRVVGLS